MYAKAGYSAHLFFTASDPNIFRDTIESCSSFQTVGIFTDFSDIKIEEARSICTSSVGN